VSDYNFVMEGSNYEKERIAYRHRLSGSGRGWLFGRSDVYLL
jgi:hypothetical protein